MPFLLKDPVEGHLPLKPSSIKGHLHTYYWCVPLMLKLKILVRSDQGMHEYSTVFYWSLVYGVWVVCIENSLKISASTNGGPRSRVCTRKTLRSAHHRH